MSSSFFKEYNTRLKFSKIDIAFFNKILLKDVLIQAPQGDTLLYAERLFVGITDFDTDFTRFEVGSVELENFKFYLLEQDSSGVLNLDYFLESFKSSENDTSQSNIKLNITDVKLKSGVFLYKQYVIDKNESSGNFNPGNIHVTDLNLRLKEMAYSGDSLKGFIQLSLKESDKFFVSDFSGEFLYSSSGISLGAGKIALNKSVLNYDYLSVKVDSFADFKNVFSKPIWDVKINDSKINFNELSYFISDIQGLNKRNAFSLHAKGTLESLLVDKFILDFGKSSFIDITGTVTQLSNLENTLWNLNFNKLKLSSRDLLEIPGFPFKEKQYIELPEQINMLGNVNLSGVLSGKYTEFDFSGFIETKLGAVDIKTKLTTDSLFADYKFDVELNSDNVLLEEISGVKALSSASLNINAVGEYVTGVFSGEVKAVFPSIMYNQYIYNNIEVTGRLSEKNTNVYLNIDDGNLKIKFLADAFEQDSLYNIGFRSIVNKADLSKTNLVRDSVFNTRFKLMGNILGSGIDNLSGVADIADFYVENQRDSLFSKNMSLSVKSDTSGKVMLLNSDFLNLGLTGIFNTNRIYAHIKNYLHEILPSLIPKSNKGKDTLATNEFADFYAKVQRGTDLANMFLPGWQIADEFEGEGTYAYSKGISFDAVLPVFSPDTSLVFEGAYLSVRGDTSCINVNTEVKEFKYGEYLFNNINIQNIMCTDTVYSYVNWINKDSVVNSGDISTMLTFFKDTVGEDTMSLNYDFLIDTSYLSIADRLWLLNPGNVVVRNNGIEIKGVSLESRNQRVFIDGVIAENPQKQLKVGISNLYLDEVIGYLNQPELNIRGVLSGDFYLSSLYKEPILKVDANISGLVVNKEMYGELKLKSDWFGDESRLNVNAYTTLAGRKAFKLSGDYFPQTKSLTGTVEVNKLRLDVFNPYLEGILSDVKGRATGSMEISGSVEKPEIDGFVSFEETYFTVDYTRVRYRISNIVMFSANAIMFDEFDIFAIDIDEGKHKQKGKWQMLTLTGQVNHQYFSDFNLDLNLKSENFLVLNTEEGDNDLFFGQVYLSSLISVKGVPEKLDVDISAKTEDDTYFFIPLMSEGDISGQYDFISFVSESDTLNEIEIEQDEETGIEGVDLNCELTITPTTELQIIFDAKTGDLIKARGDADLKVNMNRAGDLTLVGDYIISDGDYLFTLQNIINKKFDIEAGSKLSWSGDPAAGTADITAIYRLKTPLATLMNDTGATYSKRTSVECIIEMENDLMNPDINFDVGVPLADDKVNSRLNSMTEDDVNKQFLSLLVLNKFFPTGENDIPGSGNVGNVGGATSSELLSNQVSHWLSQISDDFDLGVNYRPGDEISNEQLEVALSTQLFNDRVTINGNVGVGGQKNTNASALIGDFDVNYKLTKNGKIQLKTFGRSNDNYIIEESPFTYGLGIFFRHEFNSLIRNKEMNKGSVQENNNKEQNEQP